jgi:hypothetical protein
MCSLILHPCSGPAFLDKSLSAPARSDAHYDVLRRENEKLKAQLVLLQEEKNRIAKQVGAMMIRFDSTLAPLTLDFSFGKAALISSPIVSSRRRFCPAKTCILDTLVVQSSCTLTARIPRQNNDV